MNKIELTIQQIMSIVFEKTLDQISVESSQDNIDTWDSLKHFDLVVSLENEFDITIPLEEIGNLTSFKLIVIIIEEQLKNEGKSY